MCGAIAVSPPPGAGMALCYIGQLFHLTLIFCQEKGKFRSRTGHEAEA